MASPLLPPPRPAPWPLRPMDSARLEIGHLPDGRRSISIHHAELVGVTAEMLRWWHGHIPGGMECAGKVYPRDLIWHPFDHISYRIITPRERIARTGSRLHIREAFQRNPENLLDTRVKVERLDSEGIVISHRALGLPVFRLTSRFEQTPAGVRYKSVMIIGSGLLLDRMGLRRVLGSSILTGEKVLAWVRHHIEEVGNLQNFLPALYAENVAVPRSYKKTVARWWGETGQPQSPIGGAKDHA